MKKFFIFILIVILIIGGVYAAFYKYVNRKGRELVINALSNKYRVKSSLGSLAFRFPFRLELTNFSCGDLSFDKARLDMTGLNPFKLTFILDNVYVEKLNLKVEKKKKEFIIEPFLEAAKEDSILTNDEKSVSGSKIDVAAGKKAGFKERMGVIIKKIVVKDSSLNIINHGLNPPLELFLKNFNMEIKNFRYPELSEFHIKLQSSLEVETFVMKDILNIKGWVDLKNKNLDANVRIKNFDYAAFEKYYPHSWKTHNLNIEEAFLSLEMDLKSVNNDLSIDFILVLEDITFVKSPEDLSKVKRLKTILAFFEKNKDEKPMFKSPTIKTRMDRLEVDFFALWQNLRENIKIDFFTVLGGLLGKTPEIIEKGGEEIKKITMEPAVETIKSLVDIFKGLLIMGEKEGKEGKKEDSEKLHVPDAFKIKF
ncbi:MAG: DUF748 domain-containing protein [Candidatus Omnitrophica bacterium]|nr:DUF748 domain-containing protein [Candidatus Omnitrophota bacterium]